MVRLTLAYSTPLTVATMSSVESGSCAYRLLKLLCTSSESALATTAEPPRKGTGAGMLLPSVPMNTVVSLRRLEGAQ